jgi:ABC-type transport system involved in multi-copper enzyme maturation permease subunit
MKKALFIFRKEFRDIIRSKMFLIFIGIMCASLTPGLLNMRRGIANVIEQSSAWGEIKPMLEYQIGFMLWLISFLVLILLPFVLGLNSLIQEKARRVTESLLATPLEVKSLWWGKSLGAFLPAVIVNLVITVIIAAVLNFLIIEPATGHFVLPPATLVTCLVVLPLLVLPLVLILTLVILIANPQVATIVGVLLVVGLAQVPAQLFPRIGIAITSWNFAWMHLGIAALLGGITFFLARLLTKERVVLSSKG